MIYEYALDPDLFFEWAKSTRDFRHYIRAFGIGTPRFISSFPKNKTNKWKKYVWDKAPADLGETEKLRVDELLLALSEARVERDGYVFPDQLWIDGALEEHGRLPFEGVFTKEMPAKPVVACFTADDTHGGGCGTWDKKHMLTSTRTANALADAVSNLLRLSNQIVIVEPYGYKTPAIKSFEAFIQRMMTNRVGLSIPQLTIMFDAAKPSAPNASFIHQRLAPHAAGFDLRIIGINERLAGEKLHNRYILTELGGVSFGVGTDEGEAHHTDDLVLMDGDMYRLRWDQYVANPVFDFPDICP